MNAGLENNDRYIRKIRGYLIEYYVRWVASTWSENLIVPTFSVYIRGMSVAEVSDVLMTSRGNVESWIQSERVDSWKEGNRRWVDVSSLMSFLKRNKYSYDYYGFIDHLGVALRSIRNDISGGIEFVNAESL